MGKMPTNKKYPLIWAFVFSVFSLCFGDKKVIVSNIILILFVCILFHNQNIILDRLKELTKKKGKE